MASMSCAMVGSAILAIEVTSTDMRNGDGDREHRAPPLGGGSPSATSISLHRVCGASSPVCLTTCRFVNKLCRPMELPHYEGVVLPEWIDNNGHLNLAYYCRAVRSGDRPAVRHAGCRPGVSRGHRQLDVRRGDAHALRARGGGRRTRARGAVTCSARTPSGCTISTRCSMRKRAIASPRRS